MEGQWRPKVYCDPGSRLRSLSSSALVLPYQPRSGPSHDLKPRLLDVVLEGVAPNSEDFVGGEDEESYYLTGKVGWNHPPVFEVSEFLETVKVTGNLS